MPTRSKAKVLKLAPAAPKHARARHRTPARTGTQEESQLDGVRRWL